MLPYVQHARALAMGGAYSFYANARTRRPLHTCRVASGADRNGLEGDGALLLATQLLDDLSVKAATSDRSRAWWPLVNASRRRQRQQSSRTVSTVCRQS